MTRPPYISPPQSADEIFRDRRARKPADSVPPEGERRSRLQFDAIPWWLKVNYTKGSADPNQLNEEESKKQA
jgi:hypothetical protein